MFPIHHLPGLDMPLGTAKVSGVTGLTSQRVVTQGTDYMMQYGMNVRIPVFRRFGKLFYPRNGLGVLAQQIEQQGLAQEHVVDGLLVIGIKRFGFESGYTRRFV